MLANEFYHATMSFPIYHDSCLIISFQISMNYHQHWNVYLLLVVYSTAVLANNVWYLPSPESLENFQPLDVENCAQRKT